MPRGEELIRVASSSGGTGHATQPSLRARSAAPVSVSPTSTSPSRRPLRSPSSSKRKSLLDPCFALSVIAFLLAIALLLLPSPPRAQNLHSPSIHAHRPSANVLSQPPKVLSYDTTNFTVDAVPTRIVSASVHYFRTVPTSWPGILRAARAMGLNAVATYVPWNLHEPRPGVFVFSGMLDLRAFLEAAHAAGLMVLLRPGPYICAEWDMGGLPAWLLRTPNIRLRSTHPRFMRPVQRFADAVAEQARPYIGRPVVALQLENEYGAYGSDGVYMHALKRIWEARGFRRGRVAFFTSDNGGARSLLAGSPFRTADVLKTVNLGKGVASKLRVLRRLQPDGPAMIGEFWAGWFDHWGEKHHARAADDVVDQVRLALHEFDASVNLYMFFGGTNFGFTAGANVDAAAAFRPTTTSYDYDAFLTEDGRVRSEKYLPMQKMLRRFWHSVGDRAQLLAMPSAAPPSRMLSAYAGPLRLREGAPLLDLLEIAADARVQSRFPLPMEDVGRGYGFVLYRHTLDYAALQNDTDRSLLLRLSGVRDTAYVLADGRVVGTVERDLAEGRRARVPFGAERLDILVEARGRVNYGRAWLADRKGLLGNVTLAGRPLEGFDIFPLSFASDHRLWPAAAQRRTVPRLLNALVGRRDAPPLRDKRSPPTLFRGTLWIAPGARDHFPDGVFPGTYARAFGRGVLWVNGFNVGRFHTGVPGPQRSLYVPGALLQEGRNEFLVLHQNMLLVRGAPEPLLQMFAQPDYGPASVYDSRAGQTD